MKNQFTICVLLYGDYPELAERCLTSIKRNIPNTVPLRIGMNTTGDRTNEFVHQFAIDRQQNCDTYTNNVNPHKYPTMRYMLHGEGGLVTTPYTMWFDDDSFISYTEREGVTWLDTVSKAMEDADMIGSVYTIGWQGQQREFVKAQPWYNGKDPSARPKIRFATGGWWTIRTPLLYELDYPWPVLDHRGGDVMLGEACYQRGLRLNHFNSGVRINADEHGRESKSPRRGFNQQPIGFDFTPGIAETLHRATSPMIEQPPVASSIMPAADQPKRRKIVEL